jgi:hypothetical protein
MIPPILSYLPWMFLHIRFLSSPHLSLGRIIRLFSQHTSHENTFEKYYVEKYNDIPEKTHSLVLLIDLPELDLPSHILDSLIVINRLGITGRYPPQS